MTKPMQDAAVSPAGSQRPWALTVVVCVVFLNVIDVTILNVAIPTIQRELGAGDTSIQWLVAGYASVFGILLMTGGRLGDIYGYRRVLVVGLVGFIVTSLICGLASSSLQLVVSRMAQGATAALMTPQVTSMVQLLYRPRERVAILGLFGVLGGAAAVAGPLIGGILIDADLFGLGWRMIFLVNLPFGLLLLVGALRFLPVTRSALAPTLDVAGVLLVTLCFVAVLVPLVEGRALGWPAWCLALLASSPLLLLATVRYSRSRVRRVGSAMLVPSLFRDQAFTTGIAISALFQATMAGTLFVLTIALQYGLGFSPRDVGLVHAPFAVGVATGIGVLARNVLPRIKSLLVIFGATIMGLGLTIVCWQIRSGEVDMLPYLPTMGVLGLGAGAILGSLSPITLSEVNTDVAGAASGTMKSMQEFGGALGVAVFGGIYLSIAEPSASEAVREAVTASTAATLAVLLLIAALAWTVPKNLKVFAPEA